MESLVRISPTLVPDRGQPKPRVPRLAPRRQNIGDSQGSEASKCSVVQCRGSVSNSGGSLESYWCTLGQ